MRSLLCYYYLANPCVKPAQTVGSYSEFMLLHYIQRLIYIKINVGMLDTAPGPSPSPNVGSSDDSCATNRRSPRRKKNGEPVTRPGKYRKYTDDQVLNALQDVKRYGKSMAAAARLNHMTEGAVRDAIRRYEDHGSALYRKRGRRAKKIKTEVDDDFTPSIV